MLLTETIPAENHLLRQRIYAGEIFKAQPTAAALTTVEYINEALACMFDQPLDKVHERFPEKHILEKMRQLRQSRIKDPVCIDVVSRLMTDFGFHTSENAFDDLRVRSVLHNGHLNPDLERSYSLHRDTWYANPQCQVNWWIALQDVPQERAFSFYPSHFNKGVENTSAAFDYNDWMKKVGWQNTQNQQAFAYPQASLSPPVRERESFSCKAGEILLFSAAHLHQTNANTSGLSRFSVDFRTVHLDDHAQGKGTPNADNGSRPDALQDYIQPRKGRP